MPTDQAATPTTIDEPDVSPESTDDQFNTFQDYLAKRLYGYADWDDANEDHRNNIKSFVEDWFRLANGISDLSDKLDTKGWDGLPPWVKNMIGTLVSSIDGEIPVGLANDITIEYVKLIEEYNGNTGQEFERDVAQYIELRGKQILDFLARAKAAMDTDMLLGGGPPDPYSWIKGYDPDSTNVVYEPEFDWLSTNDRLQAELLSRPGRFRTDTPPSVLLPWQCRIGASTFLVPPINIKVSQSFHTQSLTGGAIRQPNSPKTNLGHSEVDISLTLIFPNHESIWGFPGDEADLDIFNWDPEPYRVSSPILGETRLPGATVTDEEIDYYLSSLRGLITQFKYSPILPIDNQYINRTYGITAVTMHSMTVSTIENFPFVLQVTLDMKKFNFQPYLPMIQSFDQAIHWGRFRQYLGRAAAALDMKVNEAFLIERDIPDELPQSEQFLLSETPEDIRVAPIPRFNKLKEWRYGKNFDFWFPTTTPSRIYVPDTTDFRQEGEDLMVTDDIWDGFLSSIGLNFVDAPFFNFEEYSNATYRVSSERQLLNLWLKANNLIYNQMNDAEHDKFIDEIIQKGYEDETVNESNEDLIRDQLNAQWYYMVFDGLIHSTLEIEKIRKNLEDAQNYKIKEWEVPMQKLYINWDECIVQGVSVNMLNNFAPMQFESQENPTYQHIGGGDSTLSVSMLVIGEDNIINFQRMFGHINGLARLEQGHGVLGFLGIKNVITAMCGVKYVLPLSFESQTVPNQPHVYQVNMSFVDFDVMQQRREELNNSQQEAIVTVFGKRNPFLRLKQMWHMYNGYPDMPLDVFNEHGNLLGYLDPDWYFRSFIARDQDITTWGIDPMVNDLIVRWNELTIQRAELNEAATQHFESRQAYEIINTQLLVISNELDSITENLIKIYEDTQQLVPGYIIEEGSVVKIADLTKPETFGQPESRQFLGVYGENNEISAFVDFMPGGYFLLGYEDIASGEENYVLGMTAFREDLASANTKGVRTIPGHVGLSEHQQEHINGSIYSNSQFEAMMQDFDYRNLKGRMLKAFPTYMLWLIDEGGRFAGIKLFDNFYGLNSVIDFAVHQSEDCIEDTLVLTLSNIYEKLTIPFHETTIPEDSPIYETPIGQWINTIENRARNIEQGLTNELLELNSIRLKPGTRVHLRAGYGSNPNNLQTLFNGTIAEVQQGQIMTVICQSDAVELTGMVNSTDTKGDTGKVTGGMGGLWMAEPRDLMVRLLSMGSSTVKEWIAWGTRGVIFSESKFGIRHFGNILYEPLTDEEETAHANMQAGVYVSATHENTFDNSAGFVGVLGDKTTQLGQLESISSIPGFALDMNLYRIAHYMWMNSFANRDYEIFKRNIYPGNGMGIAQYMGGDMIDGGLLISRIMPSQEDIAAEEAADDAAAANTSFQGLDPKFAILEQIADEEQAARIANLWEGYHEGVGYLTDEELLEALGDASAATIDLSATRDDPDQGLLPRILNSDIIKNYGIGGLLFPFIGGNPFGIGPVLLRAVGAATGISAFDTAGDAAAAIISPVTAVEFLGKGIKMVVAPINKLMNSPIGKALGLTPVVADDDAAGYDEISFRAQTYMKTVWDMFKLCAALLPNYIVAVRPFEERSTVFYGKPHWLYSSGVIPISTGINVGNENRPRIEEASKELSALLEAFTKASAPEANLKRIIDEEDLLKDIMNFQGFADPNAVAGSAAAGNPETQALIDKWFTDQLTDSRLAGENLTAAEVTMVKEFILSKKQWLSQFDNENILNMLHLLTTDREGGITAPNIGDEFQDNWDWMLEIAEERGYLEALETNSADTLMEEWFEADTTRHEERFAEQLEESGLDEEPLMELAHDDPITFAWQFGWRFSFVPVWISPTPTFGSDTVGDLARRKYDEDYDMNVDATGEGRGLRKAIDIWRDFRTPEFRGRQDLLDEYMSAFPNDIEAEALLDEDRRNSELGNFNAMLDLFMRFLWQDPFNRAWVVNVIDVDRVTGSEIIGEIVSWAAEQLPGVQDDQNKVHWIFDPIVDAWIEFVNNPITFDENGSPESGPARAWMVAHDTPGKNASNSLTGFKEDTMRWVDENLGQFLGIIGDTLTGFISSIRMSLSQVGNALSQSGDMQRQANILNAVFDNSMYYQFGPPDSLIRMIDNPFTREYGEPVIEIREPFQRVHFVSSFDSILHNGVKENLMGVPTTVTAVSDGKYPVKVHLDKALSPDRQTEMIVETGLYWDNAFGSGLFGMFQPLLHPFEAIRSYSKSALGSSDELSTRRVALSHLKEGLKDMYMGELILIGSPDIRPFDLLYIADITQRMYGLVEVESVRHNFSPQTGFTTHVTPNALVTVNDPARWTMLSYVTSKFSNYNLRDDVRTAFDISVDRTLSDATLEIERDDIYRFFGTQMNGSIQYTMGNAALVRDIAAMYTGNGVDDVWNSVAKADIAIGLGRGFATIAAGVVGSLIAPGVGTAIGAGAGWTAGELAWDAWTWVKDNLLDQHGCYIQFLNKGGQAMDAGLSHYQGLAVGSNHTVDLFPGILGLKSLQATIKPGDHYRITTNDLLGQLGWTEVDTVSLYRETSMFVNMVNAKVLELSGRSPIPPPIEVDGRPALAVVTGKITNVVDGDTLDVVVSSGDNVAAEGTTIRVRFAGINTSELIYYNLADTRYDETLNNDPQGRALAAYNYLKARFTTEHQQNVAIRMDRSDLMDSGGDRYLGLIFHNTPLNTPISQRITVLKDMAGRLPLIPWDAFMEDGRPYTLNWEMVMTGFGDVFMRDSLWDEAWRENSLTLGSLD